MKTKLPVNTEKQLALNNHILPNSLFIVFGFLLTSFGMWSQETVFVVFGALLFLIFVFILLISPTHYVFSCEYVVICHPFKRKETICWDDIRSIKKYGSWLYPEHNGFTHYKIYYRNKKERLFLNGEICRSRKTKQLLKKYYKGTVE